MCGSPGPSLCLLLLHGHMDFHGACLVWWAVSGSSTNAVACKYSLVSCIVGAYKSL